jgi:hypothetical protein
MKPPRLLVIALLVPALVVATSGPGNSETPAKCLNVAALVETGIPLPRVAGAIANKRLDVLVVGAGSSALPGAEGPAKSYPARLQAVLAEKLPDITVKVAANVKSGRTTADMVSQLGLPLAATKPALMIWQTGTVDAMRSSDLEAFNAALDKGVHAARAANADVIFINSQYSPRTESMIALVHYTEHLRWVALQQNIPLFDRYSIMKLWAELGTFDFYAPTKTLDTAAQVHDCIARLLADLVVEGAKLAASPNGGR